ncbi:hypothetical protein PoB_007066000 [Plakobranchus ocellatus]|uniref:Uncharacterized protein n=1 Tax=Plakobranchus ocellatus TaxID=259542 RepID=A0AAV4DJ37_9GAST|nr:hypothetical protein PoB_007066000 [Plakobranchus ocellatus]
MASTVEEVQGTGDASTSEGIRRTHGRQYGGCYNSDNIRLVERSGGSSGRVVGYQVRGPGFESQSGRNQCIIAPLCTPSNKWVARSLQIRRNILFLIRRTELAGKIRLMLSFMVPFATSFVDCDIQTLVFIVAMTTMQPGSGNGSIIMLFLQTDDVGQVTAATFP